MNRALLGFIVTALYLGCSSSANREEVLVLWDLRARTNSRKAAPSFATEFQCVFLGVTGNGISETYPSTTFLGNYTAGCFNFGMVSNVVSMSKANGSIRVKPGSQRQFKLYGVTGLRASSDCDGSTVEQLFNKYAPYVYAIGTATQDIAGSTTVNLSNTFKSEATHVELTGSCSESNGVTISNSPTYDFGSFSYGAAPPVQSLTVTNNTSSTVSIAAVSGYPYGEFSYPGGAFPGGGSCGNSLPAGTSCDFQLQYAPSTTLPVSSVVKIEANVGGKSLYVTRRLSGTYFMKGEVDPNFNSGSMKCVSVGSAPRTLTGIAVDADGVPALAGKAKSGINEIGIVAWSDKNGGSISSSEFNFGAPVGTDSRANAIRFSSKDDRWFVAGLTRGTSNVPVLARLKKNANGIVLDSDFNPGGANPGYFPYSMGTGSTDTTSDLIFFPTVSSNEVLVGGIAGFTITPISRIGLARIDPTDASFVESFGTSGKAIDSNFTKPLEVEKVAIADNGKIAVAAVDRSGSRDETYVVLFTAAGVLDTSFNSTGFVKIDSAGNHVTPFGLAFQRIDDKNRLLVGLLYDDSGTNHDSRLYRYKLNGDADLDFNSTGTLQISVSSAVVGERAKDMLIQRNGRIAVIGIGYPTVGPTETFLETYSPSGTNELDKFLNVESSNADQPERLAETSNGQLHVGAFNSSGNFCIYRIR